MVSKGKMMSLADLVKEGAVVQVLVLSISKYYNEIQRLPHTKFNVNIDNLMYCVNGRSENR